MRVVPERSKASALSGLWFVFHLDGHTFALWASAITGKELLHVDGVVVSTHRHFGFSSSHAVSINNVAYTVALRMRKMRKGNFECTLSRSGEVCLGQETEYTTRLPWVIGVLTISATAGLLYLRSKSALESWELVGGLSAVAVASLLWSTYGRGYIVRDLQGPFAASEA